MSPPTVALLGGDGIGPEVLTAARSVLDAIGFEARYVEADIGWRLWSTEGDALPQRTVRILEQADAALFGAVTSLPGPEAEAALVPTLQGTGLRYRSPIVRLRQHFDLFANVRPCRSFAGNPLQARSDIDLVVVRENTQGLYAGLEFDRPSAELQAALSSESAYAPYADAPEGAEGEVALSVRVISARRAQRIVRFAAELALARGETKVTLVEKANVLRATSGLMVRSARTVMAAYPLLELEEVNIDAAAMWLVKRPQEYGVLVASNLFGDILSDLCAQLVGGLGLSPSGSYGPKLALFEPTHGSAPKYAGKGIANPLAMLLSAAMMLHHLHEVALAQRLERAVATVLEAGRVRTADLGGSATTTQMAQAVADACDA